ncbi:AGAP005406-PA-like protein [Anopheles sinensis]|uniref:AGAP005406-PA-like protein n=1 Tax=Anopheles sinensis TaxID=74873 RepID=A0A084VDP2_ANOSI|nr:AGAP005406-PA-like protein [Anopheles sinensis]
MLQELRSGEYTNNLRTPFETVIEGDEKTVKSKKELRLERKKRKLLALSAVMMLNDQEGIGKHSRNVHSAAVCDQTAVAAYTQDSSTVSEAKLRTILANNRTAFDITEEQKSDPDRSEDDGPLEAKRRKAEDVSNINNNNNNNNGVAVLEGPESGDSTATTSLDSAEEYRALKAYVNQKKNMRYSPRVILKPVGQDALLDRPVNGDRIPLLLDDIQALLMYALLRTDSPLQPRWASIHKSTKLTHTVVLVVEGFSCEDYVTLREHMPASSSSSSGIFGPEHTLQVICPTRKLVEEMACVPLSDTHKDILVAEYGSLEAAMQVCKDQMLVRRSIFRNITQTPDDLQNVFDYSEFDLPPSDKYPRTQLLLSPIQMINEGYPVPLTGTLQHRYRNYVTTSDYYLPVTPRSPMFGLDCEMCGIAGNKSVLTRVSIVDEAGATIYDELVKPRQPIVDYRFEFSGITKEMLANVTKRIEDVQREIRALLPRDAILVGQSLNCDMDALQMMHPYVIDSSIVFNLTGTMNQKAKLRLLTKKFLNRDIQCPGDGHNPIEDCAASLELVQMKLSKSIYYGDQWLQDRSKYHRFLQAGGRVGIAAVTEDTEMHDDGGVAPTQQQRGPEITSTLFAHAKKRNKRSAIVTNDNEELSTFEAYFGDTILHSKQAHDANAGSRQWISFERKRTADEAIRKAAADSLQYDFNLTYVKLPHDMEGDGGSNNDDDAEAKKIALAQQIDGWIEQLYKAMSLNGLFVVLLAGQEEQVGKANRIAVAMVQTKK